MKKIVSISLIVFLVLNLFLFGFGMINDIVFWIVIAVCGIGAYLVKKF